MPNECDWPCIVHMALCLRTLHFAFMHRYYMHRWCPQCAVAMLGVTIARLGVLAQYLAQIMSYTAYMCAYNGVWHVHDRFRQ
jgi:hypothetical protein